MTSAAWAFVVHSTTRESIGTMLVTGLSLVGGLIVGGFTNLCITPCNHLGPAFALVGLRPIGAGREWAVGLLEGTWLTCGHGPHVFETFLVVFVDGVEGVQRPVALVLGEAFEQLL